MKAILIKTKEKTITEVEYRYKYGKAQELMGVDMLEVGFYLGADCCYIDEEGRINGTNSYFYYNGQEFAGNGLIVGTTEDGNDASYMLFFEFC